VDTVVFIDILYSIIYSILPLGHSMHASNLDIPLTFMVLIAQLFNLSH